MKTFKHIISSDNLPYEKVGKNEPVCIADEVTFEIPDSWEWVRLGNICDMYTGDSINENEKKLKFTNISNGRYYIGTKDVGFDHVINYDNGVKIPEEYIKFRVAPAGCVLLCIEGGSAGRKIAITNKTVCFGNKLCCFNSFSNNNKKFLYFYLQSPAFTSVFKDKITGIIGGVSINNLKELYVPLPPLPEQQRIVDKLKELEPYINDYDKAYEKIEKLNTDFPDLLKKSILQEAVQGKLVPQDPTDESASVLIEQIRKEKEQLIKDKKIKKDKNESYIFRRDNSHYEKIGKEERCIDDEIPFDIPDSWEWCTLASVTEQIHYGYTASAAPVGDAKLARITDIQDNKIMWETVPYCSISKENLPKYKLKNRDILIARTGGTIGKTYIVRNLNENAVFASYLIRAIPLQLINEEYLKLFMESPLYWEQLKTYSMGTGQPNVNGQSLSKLRLPLPPLNEQQRIVEYYKNILPKIKALK